MTPQERIHWPPFTHGRLVCKCGNVVAQCRCRQGCEVVGIVDWCGKCQPAPSPARGSQATPSAEKETVDATRPRS
jgi:hypothetical protein